MAYKDEYEVARLYTNGEFRKKLQQKFDGDYKLHFHLAPPLLAKRNAKGELVKKEYGPWVYTAFGRVDRLRGLPGGAQAVLGYSADRRKARRLIDDYVRTAGGMPDALDGGNVAVA